MKTVVFSCLPIQMINVRIINFIPPPQTLPVMWYVVPWRACASRVYAACSVMSDSLQPMDCSPQSFSVHGITQVRILE